MTVPSNSFDHTNPDHQFWWEMCSPSIKALFRHSGTYTAKQQQDHLNWFRDIAVPSLGQRPSSTYRLSSLLNWEGSPYRPSWNFSGSGSSTVRLGFDPIGPQTGTDADPFGQRYLERTNPVFAQSSNPVADMTWFDEIASSMYLTPEEEANLHAKWPAGQPRPPHHFLAWGCKGSEREFKPYFHPMLKAAATGRSVHQVTYDGARAVSTLGDELKPTIDLLEDFHVSRADIMTPLLVAVDCIEPVKSRLKIYAMAQSNAFNVMRDSMTLGGQKTDPETLRGVDCLESIYHLLMGEKRPLSPSTTKKGWSTSKTHQATILSWEMKPGRLMPEVKIYLPMWQFAQSEAAIVDNMGEIFRGFGWNDAARMYGPALQEAL